MQYMIREEEAGRRVLRMNSVCGIHSQRAVMIGLLLSMLYPVAFGKTNYKKWLNEEVVWIISKNERKEFKKIKNDGDRDKFIDRFWQRRDPTPNSEANEYKEEHYRRLIFAKKAFQEGIPGWKTDRGRVYILHGPPGAVYFLTSQSKISPLRQLAPTERSPNTIVWVYHQNQQAKFYKGEMRLVFQPSNGLSRQNFVLSESLTSQQKADQMSRLFYPATDTNWLEADVRFRLVMAGPPALINSKGADLPNSGLGEFTKYVADLLRAPGDRLDELEDEMARRNRVREELRHSVKARVVYQQLGFEFSTQAFYRPGAEWLILLKMKVPLENAEDEKIDVSATLVDDHNKIFDEFIDSVRPDLENVRQSGRQFVHYFNSFSAPSGRYKVQVALRGVTSKRAGYKEDDVTLSTERPQRLRLGSVLLTNHLQVPSEGESLPVQGTDAADAGDNQIVFNGARIRPNPSGDFSNGDHLFLYFQAWIPEATPEISLNANFIHDGQIVRRLAPRRITHLDAPCLEYGTAIPLSGFDPGGYTLQIQVLDHSSKTFDIRRTSFQILTDPQRVQRNRRR